MFTILLGSLSWYFWKFEKDTLDFLLNPRKPAEFLKIAITFTAALIFVLADLQITAYLILEREVNSQLGFDYSTPETKEGELFLITEVVSGKYFDASGIKINDQIRYCSVSDLYSLLIFNQGKCVTLPITRDGNDISICLRVPVIKTHVNYSKLWRGIIL
jgi:hypothetical protein